MVKSTGIPSWPYSGLLLLELSLVTLFLGVLMSTAVSFVPLYISAARLTEPVSLVRNLQIQLIENAALTGLWETQFDDFPEYSSGVLIKELQIQPNGDFSVKLSSKSEPLDNQWLGFELFQSAGTNGHKIQSWRCGTQHAETWISSDQRPITTIPSLYTRIVCRE